MTPFFIFNTEHDFNSGTVIPMLNIRLLTTDTVRETICWLYCNDAIHKLMSSKKESEFRNSILGDTEEPVQLPTFATTVVSGRQE